MRIVAEDGAIELQATDTEISIRVPLAGTVDNPGSVVLPARLLLEVVRQLGAPEVTLELRGEEQDVEVESGTAQYHLRTLRVEDFPELPAAGATRSYQYQPRPSSRRSRASLARHRATKRGQF